MMCNKRPRSVSLHRENAWRMSLCRPVRKRTRTSRSNSTRGPVRHWVWSNRGKIGCRPSCRFAEGVNTSDVRGHGSKDRPYELDRGIFLIRETRSRPVYQVPPLIRRKPLWSWRRNCSALNRTSDLQWSRPTHRENRSARISLPPAYQTQGDSCSRSAIIPNHANFWNFGFALNSLYLNWVPSSYL